MTDNPKQEESHERTIDLLHLSGQTLGKEKFDSEKWQNTTLAVRDLKKISNVF